MNDDEVLAVARAALTQVRESLDDVRMEHPVAAVVARARARQRRRRLSGATAVGSMLAVSSLLLWTGLLPGGSGTRTGSSVTQARTVAYVVSRVKVALTSENMVFHGDTTSTYGPSTSWAYGPRSRYEEYTGRNCGHYTLPNGKCTHRGGSERYLAAGTTLIKGKLLAASVTYFNHQYSLSRLTSVPPSACSTTARLAMGGPGFAGDRWPAFINASLACGTANVTGHVRINGVDTMKITGVPATVSLSPGYAKVVQEVQARVQWALYVDPKTFLPVRISGSTATFGGPAPSTLNSSVTNVQWLPPTPANKAMALVAIPPGYKQVSTPKAR